MVLEHRVPTQDGPEPTSYRGSEVSTMFYHSVVASTILYADVYWGWSVKAGNDNQLNKLVRNASSVIGGGTKMELN